MTPVDSSCDPDHWFDKVESVVGDPLRFKIKLDIGEDAYKLLRLRNKAYEVWEVAGASATGAAVASSSAVATTFFAPTGFWAMVGLGGAAATPVGWVVAAGVVSGGAWLGVTRYLKSASSSRVKVVPDFINAPIDVLALGLFDLLAPLALKVAAIDGVIAPEERMLLQEYFVDEWGFDDTFVDAGLTFSESKLTTTTVGQLADALAEFKRSQPDCNYDSMTREIVHFLERIAEADGRVDERETMAIDNVKRVFAEKARFDALKVAKKPAKALADGARSLAGKFGRRPPEQEG